MKIISCRQTSNLLAFFVFGILDRTYIGRIVGFADGEELRNNQAIELSVEKNMVASNAEPVKDERPSGVPHLASGSGA